MWHALAAMGALFAVTALWIAILLKEDARISAARKAPLLALIAKIEQRRTTTPPPNPSTNEGELK